MSAFADETSTLRVTNVSLDGKSEGIGFNEYPSNPTYSTELTDDEDDQRLLEEGDGNESSNASICSLAYYKQFFNVTTSQISWRLLRALDVRPNAPLFYEDDSRPDMYGPFWVCTTLVFLIAASGNIAHYLETTGDSVWNYQFDKLTKAAWIFYSSISIIPIAVWFALGHLDHQKSLIEVVSIYGYSLTVFIPTCIICVTPDDYVRIAAIGLAFVISSIFIIRNLGNLVIIRNPERNRGTRTKGYILLGVILLCHAVIAFLMKIYFFKFD
mmetsp:Transcript_20154/g.30187  ORF Transcript_20154/g.30187 Transcript_20154/m.30187 type:complete len:270 (+) Transcript_20154:117-926(+)